MNSDETMFVSVADKTDDGTYEDLLNLMDEIDRLKEAKQATILAHYYVVSLQDLLRAKRNKSGSIVVAHPECPQNILELSDMIGGTEKMHRYVESTQERTTFLVATEANMIHPLEKAAPQHKYVSVPGITTSGGETCACNRCPHMARNTLQKVRDCLRVGEPEVRWQPFFHKAKQVIERSLL